MAPQTVLTSMTSPRNRLQVPLRGGAQKAEATEQTEVTVVSTPADLQGQGLSS